MLSIVITYFSLINCLKNPTYSHFSSLKTITQQKLVLGYTAINVKAQTLPRSDSKALFSNILCTGPLCPLLRGKGRNPHN